MYKIKIKAWKEIEIGIEANDNIEALERAVSDIKNGLTSIKVDSDAYDSIDILSITNYLE